MVCPTCLSALSTPVHVGVRDFEHGLSKQVDLRRCSDCGLTFEEPRPSLDALLSFYPDDYRPHVSGSGDGLLGRLKGIQSGLLVKSYARWLGADRAGRIADLGCGSGQFVKALARAGFTDVVGIDRNPRLAANFEGTAIRYETLELEPDFQLPQRYRTIVMNNVLEHFLDPAHVLARCREALEPGGQILLLTPNADSWSHALFGRYWSGLHAPRHPQIFSPQSLRRLAQKVGFGEVEVAPVVDPASWAFSFQNLLRSRRPAPGVARGTAWYSLAFLPAWAPLALAERLAGMSSSIAVALRVEFQGSLGACAGRLLSGVKGRSPRP